jgi:predicted amidohydrolase YtcJ
VVFVGSAAQAQRWIGPRTAVEELGGRMLLPGLVDGHIHPLDIVDLDVCDLDSHPMTLAQLSAFVAKCLAHYAPGAGGRLVVHQWNYTDGNQPDAQHPTLRAALDAASTSVRIQLLGNDGHHGAFNSPALAQAKNARGEIVGLSRATLAGELARYRPFVGVDALGEPNGAVNEDARYLIDAHSMLYTDLEAVAKVPERIPQRLNSVGITAILDAMASPDGLPVYDHLEQRGQLTVRARLALFFDPSHTLTADGQVDYDALVAQAQKIRAKYAHDPLIRADVIKLFADGVLEGNPFAVPSTLPNAAALEPFRQPIFAVDAAGHATVTCYVDTGSATCAEVRAHPQAYAAAADVKTFMKAHGYHLGQCALARGELQHERAVILEYVRRMHLAGFNLHIHTIGDRAVRTALDAIEAARAADGNAATRDALAHVQLAAPTDVVRIARDHLYVACTYAWMNTDPEYDLTVIPFFEKVRGNSYRALHRPGSYYESNVYPVRAVKVAGGIVAAGSDAPVETRDPRPFVNMARAIARRDRPGRPPLSPGQRITVREVIDAYTIDGARMLGLEQEAGSIEVDKSADFVLIDRDILALADGGRTPSPTPACSRPGSAAGRFMRVPARHLRVFRPAAGHLSAPGRCRVRTLRRRAEELLPGGAAGIGGRRGARAVEHRHLLFAPRREHPREHFRPHPAPGDPRLQHATRGAGGHLPGSARLSGR